SLLPLPPRLLGRLRETPGDCEPIGTDILELNHTRTVEGSPSVVAATDHALVINTGRGVMAIDTTTLAERWHRTPARGLRIVLRGTDVVVAEGRELFLLDGDTGEELARSEAPGQIAAIATEYDRGAA